MSVVHANHGVHKDGDFSSYGEIGQNSNGSTQNTDEFGINSKNYHFHKRIQELEDGLYEQFKEQNKNFNKDREIEVSSITPAMYRKLLTTMVSPVLMNIMLFITLIFINPIFYSIDSTKKYFLYGFIIIGLILFFNILFDAYVIYKMRKYVIEKVTNKYYVTIKKSWNVFELVMYATSITAFIGSIYLLLNPIDLQTLFEHKMIDKVLSYIVFEKYLIATSVSSFTVLVMYVLFTKFVENGARKEQKTAIIESRKGSEHNADVAENIMSGKLHEFEEEIIK